MYIRLVFDSMKYLLFLLFPISLIAQTTVDYNNELLWEISGNGLKKKSYLYGSFHTNDKRVFKFADSVYIAALNAEAIVLETDIYELFEEWDTRNTAPTILYDNEGKPYTSSKVASKTLYGSEDGMPQFLDAHFLQFAYNANKNFHPLETIEDQMNLLENRPELVPSFNALEAMLVSQERILQIYLTGDIFALDRMMQTSLKVYPDLYEDLIEKRNVVMAKGIDTLVKDESLFIAVGAGHLAGNKGIINILRNKGYRVRRVLASYTKENNTSKKEFLKYNYYTFHDSLSGLTARFPGKPIQVNNFDLGKKWIYREMGQGNSYFIELIEKNDGESFETVANQYMIVPANGSYSMEAADDGTLIAEGITDTYPDGLCWTRIIDSDKFVVIMRASGGNKFMNSNRPNDFFNKVWID